MGPSGHLRMTALRNTAATMAAPSRPHPYSSVATIGPSPVQMVIISSGLGKLPIRRRLHGPFVPRHDFCRTRIPRFHYSRSGDAVSQHSDNAFRVTMAGQGVAKPTALHIIANDELYSDTSVLGARCSRGSRSDPRHLYSGMRRARCMGKLDLWGTRSVCSKLRSANKCGTTSPKLTAVLNASDRLSRQPGRTRPVLHSIGC